MICFDGLIDRISISAFQSILQNVQFVGYIGKNSGLMACSLFSGR
jgi:hypothetical protein